MKNFQLPSQILSFINTSENEILSLLKELAVIPAPSKNENKRAEFCLEKFKDFGYKNAYVDSVKNVVCPINCENAEDIVVFCAHTDIVFPDTTPLPLFDDGKYLHCPGIGDDTACLVLLMLTAKYIAKCKLTPSRGILIVANSGEEGLGNLVGIKQIMRKYKNVSKVFTFDGQYNAVVNRCVGSHRYEISIKTEGGHSFSNFGKLNSLSVMSELIYSLYKCNVPKKENCKTTYNVGTAEGGTSVNTIAQSATFTYEYRSDDTECLLIMKNSFESALQNIKTTYPEAEIEVKLIGDRPCGSENVDSEVLKKMTEDVIFVSEKYSGIPCSSTSGSTDCNIPMSMEIPAVCVGSFIGSGAHTREEKVLKSSLVIGLKITAHVILSNF